MTEKDDSIWRTLLEQNVLLPKKSTSMRLLGRRWSWKRRRITEQQASSADDDSCNGSHAHDFREMAARQRVDESTVRRLWRVFSTIDVDGSGSLTATEIAHGLLHFGHDVSPKAVQAAMRSSDVSGDGAIDFEEFVTTVVSKTRGRLGPASSGSGGGGGGGSSSTQPRETEDVQVQVLLHQSGGIHCAVDVTLGLTTLKSRLPQQKISVDRRFSTSMSPLSRPDSSSSSSASAQNLHHSFIAMCQTV